MDEFSLINRYFKGGSFSSRLPIGIGDDCAVADIPPGYQLAFSMDSLLPNVHFFAEGDPSLVGERALRVALSDLAAMGADPLCCTLALSLPQADAHWCSGFSDGFLKTAQEFECELVGGDTVRGPMVITVQVHGLVPSGKAITRDGAAVGDLVCVTGCLGDGAAALRALKGEIAVGVAAFEYFNRAYYRPQPQIEIGKHLRGIASAAIDISDGLLQDLQHICHASGVGAELHLDCLPISEPVCADVDPQHWIPWALNGGDDYQLCFTCPEDKNNELFQLVQSHNYDINTIGRIIKQPGIRDSATDKTLKISGYQHF